MELENLSYSETVELLNAAFDIKKNCDAKLDESGARYNIFKVLKIGHDEVVFSSFLANLLNVKGKHGFKTKFLSCN